MRTIKDLKEAIENLPANMPVRILDADTNWLLEVTATFVDEDGFTLAGDYGDMVVRVK